MDLQDRGVLEGDGLGHKNALALVTLCKATPEDDTPEQLAQSTVRLPSGEQLDVAGASAREKLAAAKAIRAVAGKPTTARGRTTSAEERRAAAQLETRLHAAGLERARVRAVATRPGRGADMSIDRLPLTAIRQLCAALCRKAR